MAKKKSVNTDSVFTPIIEGIKTHVWGVINTIIQEKVKQLEKLGTEIGLLILFFLAGVLFVLTSVVFLLHEEFQASLFMSFLLVGIVSLVIALIIYKVIKKNGK